MSACVCVHTRARVRGRRGCVLKQRPHLHCRSQANRVVGAIEDGKIQPQEDITQNPGVREQDAACAFIKVAVAGALVVLEETESHQSARALTCWPPSAPALLRTIALLSREPRGCLSSCRSGGRGSQEPELPAAPLTLCRVFPVTQAGLFPLRRMPFLLSSP